MRRGFVALALLLLAALVCVLDAHAVDTGSRQLQQTLTSAVESARRGDDSAAAALCDDAEAQWVRSEHSLALFVDHDDLEAVGLSLARLAPLLRAGDTASFMADSRACQVQIVHLTNGGDLFRSIL